ncbi:hypothetical protein F4801DRAFT_214188 [Xylaria longipes]|nr:hypothetical protein F4801DRAFT_214188 [Xylaria longipes]
MDKTGKSLGRILGRCQEQLMEGSKQGQRAQASITRLEDIICAIGELGPQDPVAELDVGNRYSPGKLQVKALICDLQLLNIGAIDNTQECRLDRPVGHGTHIECRTVIGAGCGETSRVGSSTASANPSCDSQEKPLTPSQSASGHLKKVQISRRRRRRGRDRDNQPPQRQTKPRLGLLNAGFFFGCPFYFHDPEEHQDCLNHELKRIADVRQHIWRFHVQPSHCPLCGIVFHTDINYAQRDAHLLQQICEVTSDVTRCPGATSDQLASMGDRAAYRYCSTAEERCYSRDGYSHDGDLDDI